MTNKLFPSMDERDIDDLECALSCGIIPTHITESEWNELFKRHGNKYCLDYTYAKFYRGKYVATVNNENIYEFVKG